MKPRRLHWKWLLLGLLTVLLTIAVCVRLAVGDPSQFSKRVADELSAWTGGKVTLIGPVHVRYFPEVSLRGRLQLTGGSRLPFVRALATHEAKISLDLGDLMLGHIKIDALRLLRPRIVLARKSQADPQALVENLLAAGPIRIVHIRDGMMMFRGAKGPEIIRGIDAHFDGSEGGGAVSGFGSLIWHDETLRFSFDSNPLMKGDKGSILPVSFIVTSNPIKAKVTGNATFDNGLAIDGDMQAEIGNVRRLMTWLGAPIPNGQSLKDFKAVGAFHLNGATFTFDDGNFSMDGNDAVGLLAVTAGERPRVEGTLAFDRLALDPYLGQWPAVTSTGGGNALFDWALLRYFDADLRVSAGEIDAGSLKLGHGGFTISAKAGQLSGELTELELCGGSAAGRVGADLSQDKKHLSLDANLSGVSAETCLAPLKLGVSLSGASGIRTELSTEGEDLEELIRNASGELKVTAHDGAIPVDLMQLVASQTPLQGDGWSQRSTSFSDLNADCRLAAGHIWCQMINMHAPRASASGTADFDLPRQEVDISLSVNAPLAPIKASQASEGDLPQVSISGSLAQPIIRRADRTTLGDGSSQTGSLASPVSPR